MRKRGAYPVERAMVGDTSRVLDVEFTREWSEVAGMTADQQP